jgi:hypothetical protein
MTAPAQELPGEPVNEYIEGPAFPPVVRLLATVFMAALFLWGVKASDEVLATSWDMSSAAVLIAALTLVVLCYAWILRSRTGISGTLIRQTWLWKKEVALADVVHIKFLYVPYLDWLISPRIIVRARGRGFVVFHAADPRVLAAFARLSLGER